MIELQLWAWILQLAIISSAIYLFLRLARQSRGNRVVRLLVTGGLLVVVALWFLTESLQLAELQHILSSVTGFVVVVLAIVFQPELRRAMGQLAGPGGERRRDQAALGQVIAAARSMSKRRVGALVTFERDASLDPWCERGVAIDARVDRSLLESIFEPTSPMHDGGIVLRKGRILATNCVYPLTENRDLARRYGTRHRAALGLSEETDAVTLVVSEETGRCSIAVGGELRGPIDDDALEEELLAALGGLKRRRARRSLDVVGGLGGAARSLAQDIYWIAISLVLGVGILWVARGQVVQEGDLEVYFDLRSPAIVDEVAKDLDGIPVVVDLALPGFSFESLEIEHQTFTLKVVGTHAQLTRFRDTARGTLRPDDDTVVNGGEFELDPDAIDWNTDVVGLEFHWDKQPSPLTFREINEESFALLKSDVVLDTSSLRSSIAARLEDDAFRPDTITVRGPQEALDRLRGEGEPPMLAPLVLEGDPEIGVSYELDLAESWSVLGLTLVKKPQVTPRISRSRFAPPSSFEVPVALVCLDPDRQAELERWRIPAAYQVVAFQYEAIGILPVSGDTQELQRTLNDYVRSNLVAYLDVSDAEAESNAGSLSLEIRYHLRRRFEEETVRRELGFAPGDLTDWSVLEVRPTIDGSITLEPVDAGE